MDDQTSSVLSECRHCGAPISADAPADHGGFCCAGCAGAFSLLNGLGLGRYYQRRSVDPSVRPLRPDDDCRRDLSASAVTNAAGESELHLMVEGIHCAACVWLIEALLAKQTGIIWARVNMTTRRLVVRWNPALTDADTLLEPIWKIGYRLVPFDPQKLGKETERHEKALLKAMAVAGFAAGNVMLLSVSVWAGHFSHMGPATRDFMHWVSALIVLPAVLYCILPFARSAWSALRAGRTNMDVPITLGVILACGVSLEQTYHHGPHAYFDSAIMLLFFLLVGRYLDSRARGRARSAAEYLLALDAVSVTVLDDDGTQRSLPPGQVQVGMTVLVAAGERIGVDGVVLSGQSDVETSLISGETVPEAVNAGSRVFAGTINLSGPLRLEVTAVGEQTLLADIVRMMEVAEQGRARHVALADRVARWYAPVVHVTALLAFLGWVFLGGMDWQPALLIAVAVLIITCPCALALAVPVVQVVAGGRLLRQGILLKSATALERLAEVDTVVFDKTGTLTEGRPELQPDEHWTVDDLMEAVSLAACSHHPLARALVAAAPLAVVPADGVEEVPGRGLMLETSEGVVRLGSRAWLGLPEDDSVQGPELWLDRPYRNPIRFAFTDRLRDDAATVLEQLRRMGLPMEVMSGDHASAVASAAARLKIEHWQARQSPADKVARLQTLKAQGYKVLMVGDGLNDAPALAAAYVSISPSSAVDVSRTAADVVFQGQRLAPLVEILRVARRAQRLVVENFVLALGYNITMVPLAVAGFVTPLFAAVAMSSSSLVVICNALRLSLRRR